MKLYEFHQNNSGGQWDKSLPRYMFIEAENAAAANCKAEALGAYFDGVDDGVDCDHCGDRWKRVNESGAVRDITDSTNSIMQFHSVIDDIEAYRIYYADGWIAVESVPAAQPMTHTAIPPYVQCRCPHCQFGKLRLLTSGSIWPNGRVQARNEAQAREIERALKKKPNAATVAA